MKIEAACYGSTLVVMAVVTNPSTGAAQTANPIVAYLYSMPSQVPVANAAMLSVDVVPGLYVATFDMTGRSVDNCIVAVNATVNGAQRSNVILFGNKGAMGSPKITVTSKPISNINKP